jgi:type VI secretion system protein ImpL
MAPRKPYLRWLLAAVTLLVFLIVLVALERLVALEPSARWGLRIGLVLLGLIAAGAILWFLRPQDEEPVIDTGDDVLLAIGGARSRLPKKNLTSRPLVLVLGPEGGAKSSLVARSGGDPELLAGQAPAQPTDAPTPTVTANVWAMQQAIVVELTSRLLTDATRWGKVLRALRAPRAAAAIGQGEAPPRAAVVCVPCDLFYAGGSGQQLATLGALLRQRLAEASRELGLALPVYVVFTKMDRVPHFEAWAAAFTNDEVRAPLGATLPFDPAADTGNHADRLGPRLEAAFQQLINAVAARRPDLLGRDTALDRRYSAYELPREMRKLLAPAKAFLIELCRPTQLGSSPQLRGFYFTGARPIVVADVAAPSAARVAAAPVAGDATSIFRAPTAAASAPAAAASGGTRRIPQWVFLERFLRDVVLADGGAASVAGGGVRVQQSRRILLGTAIAASLLLLLGVTNSWLGNRALAARVADAAQGVAELPVVQSAPGTLALPSAEALRRLDALRAQLDTVGAYVQEGPPWHLRLGLWQGDAVVQAARPVWYAGFKRQLFDDAFTAIVDSLEALPPAPGPANDYGTTYGWLKGYLITTAEPERSTPEFLAPVLLTSWQRGIDTDADVTALARRQFEYYAATLPTYNPFPAAAEASLVSRARDFLSGYTGGEQIYVNMLAEANAEVPAVAVPQAPGILSATPQVAGAFSAKGAEFMADAFRNSDRFFQGETWVVGEATASRAVDREPILAAIRARYLDDYARAWRQVVQSVTVARPTNVADAAAKLDVLSGAQSPILQVLRTVAVNTDADSAIRAVFQPVHEVTPPSVTDKFVSDKNQPYMEGLLGLQAALAQVQNMPPVVDTASAQAMAQAAQAAGADVTRARVSARRVAQGFTLTPTAAPVASAVEQLLTAPITGVEGVLRTASTTRAPAPRPVAVAPVPAPAAGGGGGGGGAADAARLAAVLNERGRALCSTMGPVLAKFPFNPDARDEASVAEVTALFVPGTGAIAAFQQERLAPFLQKEGAAYTAKPVDGVALSANFLAFFNRASQVSDALFPDNATALRLRWMARGITSDATPQLLLRHGANDARFDARTPRNEIVWPSESGREAKLDATFKRNKPVTVASATGEWALFRLVAQATRFDGAGRVEWAAKGKDAVPVVVEFDHPKGIPLLKRGWLGGFTCIPQVTQ